MLTLYRTTCYTDWKARPSHSLHILATSENREDLIAAQNSDVESWQKTDLESFAEEAEENGEEPLTQWELENVRFEMKTDRDLREFVYKDADGSRCTIVYHIL